MRPVLVRLRPVVRATRTADGLHLRGWTSSCTITGGAGLWKVWQRLAPQLSAGLHPDALAVPDDTAPAVRAAVELLLDQLREHDMLVSLSEPWGADGPGPDVAAWLESVAPDPVEAWRRLRAGVTTVTGSGPLAEAIVRSAVVAGLLVRANVTSADEVRVQAGDFTVQAGCGTEVGYVLPTTETSLSFDTEVTSRIVARLGLIGEPGEVIAALVGAAAVHRLTCALIGLDDSDLVLVARTDPLRSTYHPLLTGTPLDDPRKAFDALTDEELGPVDTPRLGALPQTPVSLALSGDTLGIGTTADAARLDAALHALKCEGVIGVDDHHARGAALRLAARHLGGEPADPDEWTTDRTARRWWKALTRRFRQPAVVDVRKLAPDAYRAEVRQGQRVLAWSVEATAADAVAFAALAATGHAQAGREGTAHVAGPEDEKLHRALEGLPGIRITPLALDPELTAAGLVAYTVDGR
ncbi:hypothetical protein [Lentzea sp. NPDC059081]|uniref:hypothetical protein n=1 Tax=Lentzea sp. NPDC059081 TaxID=3346719 RepID=UPI0036AC90C2